MARLTISQKVELCNEARQGTISPTALGKWAQKAFNLPRPLPDSTVRSILSRSDRLRDLPDSYMRYHNLRRASMLEFDAQLMELMEDFEDDDTLSAEIAIELAKYLADELGIPVSDRPKFSNGWLQKFQHRNGYSFCRLHGEAASVNMEADNAGRDKLRDIIAGYALKDVFNMDETSFFFRARANSSICRHVTTGRKQDKTRLTLAVAANADGSEKLPLLGIGKAMQPRDLKGHDLGEELDVDYTNSKKGWMTSEIYCDWLGAVDDQMRAQGRHILMLVDNVSSHDDSGVTLTNVRVQPLPPNTTAVLQPMDQGVIASLKKRYMKKKRAASLHAFFERRKGNMPPGPKKPVNMFSAFKWVSEAWAEISPDSIRNCWRHSGLI